MCKDKGMLHFCDIAEVARSPIRIAREQAPMNLIRNWLAFFYHTKTLACATFRKQYPIIRSLSNTLAFGASKFRLDTTPLRRTLSENRRRTFCSREHRIILCRRYDMQVGVELAGLVHLGVQPILQLVPGRERPRGWGYELRSDLPPKFIIT